MQLIFSIFVNSIIDNSKLSKLENYILQNVHSGNLTINSKDIKEIIDVEKLKIDVRRKARRKKIIDSIYPYLSTNKFLREKIKEFNNKK